jgi:hypothetical protein
MNLSNIARVALVVVVSASVWSVALESIARADDVSAEGREVVTFTARPAHTVLAAPAPSPSHVQICSGDMYHCGAPIALTAVAAHAAR